MKKFDVFTNSEDSYIAIPQGFNWAAFLFTTFWAFYKSLYGMMLLLLCAHILVAILAAKAPPIGLILTIGIGLVAGLKGNVWRVRKIESKGYKLTHTVEAENSKLAIESVL